MTLYEILLTSLDWNMDATKAAFFALIFGLGLLGVLGIIEELL
mgnify:CR=1 FL=1